MPPAIRYTDLGGRSEHVAGILALTTPEVELQHMIITGHACGRIAMWDTRMWRSTRIVNQGERYRVVSTFPSVDGGDDDG